jgi:hypothetical protein
LPGGGPATIFARAMRYLDWIATNQATAALQTSWADDGTHTVTPPVNAHRRFYRIRAASQ